MKPISALLLVLMLALAAGCAAPTPLDPQPTATAPLEPPALQPGKMPTVAATTTGPAAALSPAQELPATPTAEPGPTGELPPSATPPPTPTLGPDFWKALPPVPLVGERPAEIYRRGLELGNNPNAFAKVGDCGSTPAWFLGDFDRGPRYYSLGEYDELLPVIEAFNGSYARTSLAAKSGFNASSIFTSLWADRDYCEVNETPLACEYRVHRPSFAFIMLGSNDVFHPESFEPQMRQIIEFSIERGVVPILATKPGNEEGDGSINATIARLALEYDIPLWNYWAAIQDLPDHGLQEDGVHITWAPNKFDDEWAMTRGWPVRNLTALQTLDAVWRSATGQ